MNYYNKIKLFMKLPFDNKILSLLQFLYPIFYKRKFGKIGRGSYIKRPLSIINPKKIFIGKNVFIGNSVRIDCLESWNDKGYSPSLTIGDNVSIGQNCTLSCANNVTIGNDVVISFGCLITDNEHSDLPVNTHLFNKELKVLPTKIGNYTYVGCYSIILKGVKIGTNCIIGANSLVKTDVPDFTMVAGIPAKVIKKYNKKLNIWERVNK